MTELAIRPNVQEETGPVAVCGWDADRTTWLRHRRQGLGASDVLAVLGFSPYTTPWQVWAEKTGAYRPDDVPSDAADLGNDLEPWLLGQAAAKLGQPATRTGHQLYAHRRHPWRLTSPDGEVPADGALVECKTAGLASGFGVPAGWTETSIPLGYEFQARWQMHVMDRPRVHVVALVANLGVRLYTIERDVATELDLVDQVSTWYRQHITNRVEPAVTAPDADVIAALYPRPVRVSVDLDDTDIHEAWVGYRDAAQRERAAKGDKELFGTRIKALIGDAEIGLVDGDPVATWASKQAPVDWQAIARDLAEKARIELPDPEKYRRPPTRVLSVKEPK